MPSKLFNKSKYKTQKNNQNILLINKYYKEYIKELIINNKIVKPSFSHTFSKKGEQKVLIILNDNEIESGKMMFYNISNLISKYERNVQRLYKFEKIYLKYFNTRNVTDLSYMFDNFTS